MIQENQFCTNYDQQYNYLLNSHIGYGYAQHKLARALKILCFSEGCESLILGFLLPILTKVWNLSTFQQSLLLAGVTFGIPIGTAVQGLSDRYGRSIFILLDAFMLTVFGLFSSVCWNLTSFLLSRFFYNIAMGMSIPLTSTFIAEITPSTKRSELISYAWVIWCVGYVSSCIFAWFFLRNN